MNLGRFLPFVNKGQQASADSLPVVLPADQIAALGGSATLADAFGRTRVSDTGQRLDVEFLYGKQDEYFDETTTNGTVTWNANSRDLTMSLADANNGSFAKMESYPVPYTPGNSQLIDITGVLDLANLGTGTAEVFLRSNVTGSVVEETIEQSSWTNGMDSGINWQYSHIFMMDFQSLKVGSIRFFMVQNGAPVQVAAIHNDNERNTGYWQLANAPAYYHLYTTGGNTYMEIGYGNDKNAIGFRYKVTANASATMKAICCTVKSEGGQPLRDMPGVSLSVDMGVTKTTVSTTLIPLISVRPTATFGGVENLILTIVKSLTIETDNPIKIEVIHNGTLGGTPSWGAVDAESSLEYDVSASSISNGHTAFTAYVSSGGKNIAGSGAGLLGKTALWYRQNSNTGIFTICAIKTGATDADVLAGFNFEELR